MPVPSSDRNARSAATLILTVTPAPGHRSPSLPSHPPSPSTGAPRRLASPAGPDARGPEMPSAAPGPRGRRPACSAGRADPPGAPLQRAPQLPPAGDAGAEGAQQLLPYMPQPTPPDLSHSSLRTTCGQGGEGGGGHRRRTRQDRCERPERAGLSAHRPARRRSLPARRHRGRAKSLTPAGAGRAALNAPPHRRLPPVDAECAQSSDTALVAVGAATPPAIQRTQASRLQAGRPAAAGAIGHRPYDARAAA